MKRTTSWYDDFSCIGGACTYNCCKSAWKIPVTEEEYARFRKMDHPFRDTILENIEGEPGNRTYRRIDGHCALLTDEGWCSMVQHCGFDVQTAVCRDFPRSKVVYGDVEEYSAEIACPVAAVWMLEGKPFSVQEDGKGETGREKEGAYDLLLPSRSFLLDLMQVCPGEYAYGKIYLIYTLLFRLRSAIADKSLNIEKAVALTDALRSEELIEATLMQDEGLRNNRARRTMAALNALTVEDTLKFSRAGDRLYPDDRPWEYLAGLREDRQRLEEELMRFLSETEAEYPMMTDGFISYSLFLDWIQADIDKFGERMLSRAFEYTMFMLLGMTEKEIYGTLTKERFAKIISWTDRTVIHNFHLPRIIMRTLDASGAADGTGILTIWV